IIKGEHEFACAPLRIIVFKLSRIDTLIVSQAQLLEQPEKLPGRQIVQSFLIRLWFRNGVQHQGTDGLSGNLAEVLAFNPRILHGGPISGKAIYIVPDANSEPRTDAFREPPKCIRKRLNLAMSVPEGQICKSFHNWPSIQ